MKEISNAPKSANDDKTIYVNSFEDFISEVINTNTLIPDKNGVTPTYPALLFRGHSNSDYAILPSIGRGRRSTVDSTILNEERNLIDLAKYKKPNLFMESMLPIELLALLQHYGVPTRLLDVTENAFVALYFACCSNFDEDGEVLVFLFDDEDAHNYPIANAIAESYKYAFGTNTDLVSFFERVKIQPYFLEQLYEMESLFGNPENSVEWIKNCASKPILVNAPIRATRQVLQKGRYLLFPNKIEGSNSDDYHFTKLIDAIDKTDSLILKRLIIPLELKEDFLRYLNLFGINKESLFYDNDDAVAEEIKKEGYRRSQAMPTIVNLE